jgi:hypothetical protein
MTVLVVRPLRRRDSASSRAASSGIAVEGERADERGGSRPVDEHLEQRQQLRIKTEPIEQER